MVEALLAGPLRFNDLLGQIPGIAANILSERLSRLERYALLAARPYSERPPRAAYQLTAEGRELGGALRLLALGAPGAPTRSRHPDRGPLVLPDLRPSHRSSARPRRAAFRLASGALYAPGELADRIPSPERSRLVEVGSRPAGISRGSGRPALCGG